MIMQKVDEARAFFNIEEYPGNFFQHIIKRDDYIETYKILLFKQDTGMTSGFIGYGPRDMPIICINYKRNIGHQNFSLAHEIGHFFLHKGETMVDDAKDIEGLNRDENREAEAHEFAAEFLYPVKNVKADFRYIENKNLLKARNEVKLADYINELCEKYYISFSFALNRLLFVNEYKYSIRNKTRSVKKSVEPLSRRYQPYTHIYIKDHPYYQPYAFPFSKMEEYSVELQNKEIISYRTGQAIIRRNSFLEGCK